VRAAEQLSIAQCVGMRHSLQTEAEFRTSAQASLDLVVEVWEPGRRWRGACGHGRRIRRPREQGPVVGADLVASRVLTFPSQLVIINLGLAGVQPPPPHENRGMMQTAFLTLWRMRECTLRL
jgi:hypothetical protein